MATESTPLLPQTEYKKTRSANKSQSRSKRKSKKSSKTSTKAVARKLETFDGVFLPTALNVLSILMFLRFGFIIGQMGILGTLFLLVLSYLVDILTTLSISAISTNGTVKGGGAYYMISRSLGPEFGVAIGIIFFIGQILNSSLNVVGFIEPLLVNFGLGEDADILPLLPLGYFWQVLYSTVLLALCTMVALVGSNLVSKTAFLLFVILTLSTLSIPISSIFVAPFSPDGKSWYSGLSWETMWENMLPHFTANAVGSMQPQDVPETFRNLFGIFFPATAGIFAGASMSGELKTPSLSIPRGTLSGLGVTFVLYTLVIVSMGSSIPRLLLHTDIKVIQTVNLSSIIIILGELSTSLFSVIMGIVGAASLLTAIADDKILPGLDVFSSKHKHYNIYAIGLTWFITQAFLFADINQIATFITMAFLMTFIVTNIACFLLKLGSAPNFRPSFKYFSSKTAFTGAVSCFIAMFIVDGMSATLVICFLTFLILLIHYLSPPLKFGDISQLLIYHQVRKYLLRLKMNMSVKYWRPQILLLVDDPRTCWNLIGFCNHLKKGGLYILGHVIIMDEKQTSSSVNSTLDVFNEIQKQKLAWSKLREVSKIKAFVQIAVGPSLPWGVRNVYLGSGLGGMRPNITVLGFYDFTKHGVQLPVAKNKYLNLPTDECRREEKVSICQWVQIVEDLIILQATVAVAANFNRMELPSHNGSHSWFSPPEEQSVPLSFEKKKYIDLYPIQMTSVSHLKNGKSILSTNFDTYTLILQLGAILKTVPEWKLTGHVLRVIVFVEKHEEIDDEHRRLTDLLSSLRIDTEIKVLSLEDEDLYTYNFLVKGYLKNASNRAEFDKMSKILKHEQWWKNLFNAREKLKEIELQKIKRVHLINTPKNPMYEFSLLNLTSKSPDVAFNDKNLHNRRYTLTNLHNQGLSLSLNMSAHAGGNQFFAQDDAIDSSDSSDSEKEMSYSEASSRPRSRNASSVDLSNRLRMNNTQNQPEAPQSNTAYTLESAASRLRQQSTRRNQSVDRLSVRSSRTHLKPNFSSVKIPQSKVNDNEDDDEDSKPSIQFVTEGKDEDGEEHEDHDEDGNDDEEEEGSDDDGGENDNAEPEVENEEELIKDKLIKDSVTKDNKKSAGEREGEGIEKKIGAKKPKGEYFGMNKTSEMGNELKSPSIITDDGEIIQQMMTPQFMAVDDGADLNDIPKLDSSRASSIRETTPGVDDDKAKITHKQLQEELKNLNFNDIPAKGQHLILNELMKKHSDKDKTSVVLSTLPAPTIGTHLDENEAFDYTNNLAVWLDELPPVILLNSQTITVTTAL